MIYQLPVHEKENRTSDRIAYQYKYYVDKRGPNINKGGG